MYVSEFRHDSERSQWQVQGRAKEEPTTCQAKAQPMTSHSQAIATALHSHSKTKPQKHIDTLTDLLAMSAYHFVGGG